MIERTRRLIGEVLFWLHAVIFLVWLLLFLVPQSLWSNRVEFHLCYVASMVAAELLTGLVLRPFMSRFRIVCPLTTLMQQVRGVSYRNPANYNHSFVREFAERFNLHLPYGLVGALIFISLGILLAQFFLWH
jgi:hypothetical protein